MREAACLALERLVHGLRSSPENLRKIAESGVVEQLISVLRTTPPRDKLFSSAVRVLGTLARHCHSVPARLFEENITSTLRHMLRGKADDGAVEGSPVDLTSEQLHDAITLFSELLPGNSCGSLSIYICVYLRSYNIHLS